MNWLDAVIIVVILWFTFAAFHAGFIRETVTIVAAVVGVILAGLLYRELAEEVLAFIESDQVARITAFAIILGAVALAGQILALLLKPAVHMFQLGIFDQVVGAAFGFAKAVVFVEIFLFAVIALGSQSWGFRRTIDGSLFSSLIVDNVPILLRVLPEEFEAEVDNFTASLQAKESFQDVA